MSTLRNALRNQVFTGVLLASLVPAAAFAQAQPQPADQAGDADSIKEIIVTAEHRETSVQKTPLTIQVLSAEEIVKSGLSKAEDLSKLTTGVEIGTAGGNAQIFIRGVGSYAVTPLNSPGVAFNVDGVYVGRADSIGGNFYDISRIEILKGPQGTLYGRNANGGAINLITNEPKLGSTSVDLNGDVGNYDLLHFGGAVNLPLDETKAVRVAFNVISRNGYLSDGTSDDKQQEGRIRFKWKPEGGTSLLLNADYAHIGGKGAGFVFLPQRPGSDPYESVTEPAAQAYIHALNRTTAPLTTTAVKDSYQDSKYFNASAQLDTDLGFATLTVLPAYRHSNSNYLQETTNRYENHTKTDQESLEARVGNSSHVLTWVLGGYFFNENQSGTVDILGGPVLQNYHIIYGPKTRAYAAFGQTTVNVFSGFRLIGGLRYTYEHRTNSGTLTDQRTILPAPRLIEAFPGQKNFDGVTYKVGAQYDITPQNMVYGTFSTGFKAGGFSQTIAPLNVFNPEKLYAVEVGSHNRFFDNKLQLNATYYHWKYKNLQDSRVNFDPLGAVNFITFNSGDATIEGGTLELVGKVTRADTINFSGEYAHSKYDKYLFQTPAPFFQAGSSGCRLTTVPGATPVSPPNIQGDCSGFPVAHVPKWSATASYDHVFSLPNDASVTLQGDVKYSSAHYLAIDFIPSEKQAAYAVFDTSLTYDSPKNSFSATVYVKNLTDKVYHQGGIQASFIGGLFNSTIGAPRTFGVQATYHFGD